MTGPELDRSHGDWDALAVGWAMTALDPDDERRFAEHLATCGRCTATVRDAVDTVVDLAYALPPEPPPARLRRRILAAAAAEPRPAATRDAGLPGDAAWSTARDGADSGRNGRPVGGGSRQGAGGGVVGFGSRRRWVPLAAMAAAVALIAGLAVWNVTLQSDQGRLRDVVAQRDELVARLTEAGPARVAIIRGPSGTGDRQATVVVKQGRVGLITETLPPEPPGRTYWLWSLRNSADTDPVPLANFTVPETRFSACNIEPPAGVDVTRAFAISDEPGTGRPTRPTHKVAFGSTDPA